MDLYDMLDAIRTRSDLVDFLHALRSNLEGDPDGWENRSLDDYLDALARWLGSMEQLFINTGRPVPNDPTWQLMGRAVLAAKSYE